MHDALCINILLRMVNVFLSFSDVLRKVTIDGRSHNPTVDTCTANVIRDICIERGNLSYNERGDLNCIIGDYMY